MFDKVNGAPVGASNRVFAAFCGSKAHSAPWEMLSLSTMAAKGADRREILQRRDPLFE